MMLPPVILASGSPRRHDLLNLISLAHDVRPADVDEAYLPGEHPAGHAERLARCKAAKVAAVRDDALVIGADTIVVIDGEVLGKPRDKPDAARMIGTLSGRTHTVMTAIAVAHRGRIVSSVVEVSVTFRALDEGEIERYIATGEPMDKAGAYGIQGYGATIVSRIEGDYFAVMGMSLVTLVRLMRDVGVVYDFPR